MFDIQARSKFHKPQYSRRYIIGFYKDNGREKGNLYLGFRVIYGLYRDNGKENGNHDNRSIS